MQYVKLAADSNHSEKLKLTRLHFDLRSYLEFCLEYQISRYCQTLSLNAAHSCAYHSIVSLAAKAMIPKAALLLPNVTL